MSASRQPGVRRPLLAASAAMLLPGLGQVYNGELFKGLAFFSLVALAPPAGAWLAVHTHTRALWAIVVLGVLVAIRAYVAAIVDAYKTAAHLGPNYVLAPHNRLYAYLTLFLCGSFLVLAPMVRNTKAEILELFKVPSASMLPTIVPGDRFFADKSVNRRDGGRIWRGAIAVFIYPNQRTAMYVKRVIGLPGDRIDIKGTSVEVNGRTIQTGQVTDLGSEQLNRLLSDQVAVREQGDHRSYVVLWKKDAPRVSYSLMVPNGSIFVMGDNRDTAEDSRHFGVVPLADVSGVGTQILFSLGPSGFDWKRIGKSLE